MVPISIPANGAFESYASVCAARQHRRPRQVVQHRLQALPPVPQPGDLSGEAGELRGLRLAEVPAVLGLQLLDLAKIVPECSLSLQEVCFAKF